MIPNGSAMDEIERRTKARIKKGDATERVEAGVVVGVEAAPCHRTQKHRNDFRRRPQLPNADMSADRTSQKARHQDRAEDGGGLYVQLQPISLVSGAAIMASPRLNAVVRGLFRAPVYLYRWRCGWLIGHRFLLLIHTGRHTRLKR